MHHCLYCNHNIETEMDILNIPESPDTPAVNLDPTTGIIEMSGKSLPENIKEFYGPIINWLTAYSASPQPQTLLRMRMDYFNTASSKMIMEILEVLDRMHLNGHNVKVEWRYSVDDEDMLESGEDYAALLNIKFDFIACQ